MQSGFKELIYKIIQEQGLFIFQNSFRCKGLLYDYAKGKYKEDIHLFLLILEEKPYAVIDKEEFIERFCNIHKLDKKEIQVMFNLVVSIFENIENKKNKEKETLKELNDLEKLAQKGDYKAMYELGLLLEKLLMYEESNYWFKKATKQLLVLYESSLEASKKEKRLIKNKNLKKDFVKIPKGTFMMGSPITDFGWTAQETQHQVRISSFYLCAYTVTQKEYFDVIGNNPSKFVGEELPVENITWFQAVSYCNARSLKEKLTPVYTIYGENVIWNRDAIGYRLPTEAEWEYACRAGTVTSFNTGNFLNEDSANYKCDSLYLYRRKTTPRNTFPPNSWGLYDMHGNVWEWCWDWYGDYSISIQRDPIGPLKGTERVIRGGSWNYSLKKLRSACRNSDFPEYCGCDVGFRVALSIIELDD